ncbi:MAG: response regulator [Bacteroidota bacterium]
MNTIWIVDDSHSSNALLAFAVQELLPSASLLSFSSGKEVLAYLSNQDPPDTLFMDVHMGKLSGMETLAIMTEQGKKPAWVCLCSSDVDPNLPQLTKIAGADFFFVKPWGYDALLETVRGVLQV